MTQIPAGPDGPNATEFREARTAEASYREVCKIFELEENLAQTNVYTLTGLAGRAILDSGEPFDNLNELSEDDKKAFVLTTLSVVRDATSYLKDELGYDFLEDRNALMGKEKEAGLISAHQALEKKSKSKDVSSYDKCMYYQAANLIVVFGSSRANLLAAASGREQQLRRPELFTDTPEAVDYLEQEVRFVRTAAENPNRTRYETQRILKRVMSEDMQNLLSEYDFADDLPDETGTAIHQEDVEIFHGAKEQELDFTVLPAGSTLLEHAQGIVSESTAGEKAQVDLGRLQVLEAVRDMVGPEHCYYARGKRTGKTFAGDDGDRVDEDYIVLVMQNHDKTGAVLSENALAISPIARRHATYVVRDDVSEGISWREIFNLSKDDARDLGARRVKFTSAAGRDPYEALQEKLFTLLTCKPEEFNTDLLARPDGSYVMYRRRLGKAAATLVSQ